jgi:hypothetical protein
MPAMKYLRFCLDRDCVVVPGWGTTKRVRSGCGRWTVADTKRNPDMLKRNAKAQSGHHRHRRLTPNPQPRNVTRLRRVPSACPLTIRFSGQPSVPPGDASQA